MINELEVEYYIDSHLPEMPHCVHGNKGSSYIYETISSLSNFMKEKYKAHDLKDVKKIFYVAEYIYNKGSNAVKTNIENIFIYSLSSIMPIESEARRELQAIIPITIFSIYVQQILHSKN